MNLREVFVSASAIFAFLGTGSSEPSTFGSASGRSAQFYGSGRNDCKLNSNCVEQKFKTNAHTAGH